MDARKEIDDNLMLKDIEWCMEMISSNKLYDPLMLFRRNEKDNTMGQLKHNEVVTWIEQYQYTKTNLGDGPKKSGSLFIPMPDISKSRRNSAMMKNPTVNNFSSINIGTVPANVNRAIFYLDF
jgi:hypothetical protein